VAQSKKKIHILWVDDQPGFIRYSIEELKSIGYQVTVATNAKDALKKAKALRGELALIITDVFLPDSRYGCESPDVGVNLILSLKELCPRIPIAVVSAFVSPDIIGGIIARNIEFVRKPICFAELVRRIRKILAS